MQHLKKERLSTIRLILKSFRVGSQEELLLHLNAKGIEVTQATLSRDLKQLMVSKTPTDERGYIYVLPSTETTPASTYLPAHRGERRSTETGTIEFSGSLAVVKTKPGYAGGIASEIDHLSPDEILGTIAGDDTILIIPREGVDRDRVVSTLTKVIPQLKRV